jgi:hypothetical protein
LNELDTYILLSKDLGYLKDAADIEALTQRVFGLLGGLISSERKLVAP